MAQNLFQVQPAPRPGRLPALHARHGSAPTPLGMAAPRCAPRQGHQDPGDDRHRRRDSPCRWVRVHGADIGVPVGDRNPVGAHRSVLRRC